MHRNPILKALEGEFVIKPLSFSLHNKIEHFLSGYQAKYAMRYFAKANNAKTQSYTKQPLTYLVLAPYWDDNKFLSKEYWKNNQVKIEREPNDRWSYQNAGGHETYTVMRFDLTDEEIAVPAEPTLLDGIHFR